MRALPVTLASALALALALALPARAQDGERRYDAWQPDAAPEDAAPADPASPGLDLGDVLIELEDILAAARRDRAANPQLLDDLDGVLTRLRDAVDGGALRPVASADGEDADADPADPVEDERPRRVLAGAFEDTFRDGDYTNWVEWTPLIGEWSVHRRGGLVADTRRKLDIADPDQAGDILAPDAIDALDARIPPIPTGEPDPTPAYRDQLDNLAADLIERSLRARLDGLIAQAGRDRLPFQPTVPRDSAHAAIAVDRPIRNDVQVEFSLIDPIGAGAFELRLFQNSATAGALDDGDAGADGEGLDRRRGYRLVYQADTNPILALFVMEDRGPRQLAALRNVRPLRRRTAHPIRLTRDLDGRMEVTVNGRMVLAAEDATFRTGFDGLMLVSTGGLFSVRRVAVERYEPDDTDR